MDEETLRGEQPIAQRLVCGSRGLIRLVDVAGIDAQRASTEIERQMHDRAISTVESADRVILLHDSTDPSPYLEASRTPDLIVHTKSDLRSHAGLSVSAHTGENMPEFCRRLDELAFGAATGNTISEASSDNARIADLLM